MMSCSISSVCSRMPAIACNSAAAKPCSKKNCTKAQITFCGSCGQIQWSRIPCLLNNSVPQHIFCPCAQADSTAANLYCAAVSADTAAQQSRSCSARLMQQYSCCCTNIAAAWRLCGLKSSKQYCISIKSRGCCGFVLPADAAPATEQLRCKDVFRTQRTESRKHWIWTNIAAERQRYRRCGIR